MVAVFLVYWPALRNGFVWDDTALCFRDPLIRSWRLIPEGFRHFLFLDATASDFYRPLQRLTFVFDYQFYAFTQPWGWHRTSIAIHAAAAVALFFLVRKMCAARPANAVPAEVRDRLALGVAVLWAIHPLHTSAVTYIAGRADPLAALCGFSALALGLVSLENGKRKRLATVGAAACFFGALLSKESGVAALLIWFLILVWRRESWRVLGQWLALTTVVVGTYCALRFTAEKTPPPPPPVTPAAIRPILAARAVAEYAGLLVAPLELHMERDVSTHPQDSMDATLRNARHREYQTLLGVLLILGLIAWWRHAQRHDPHIGLALGAFLIAYLPISNLFSLNATVAEHWLYVPSAFLFFAAGLSLCWMLDVGRWTLDVEPTEKANVQRPTFNVQRSKAAVAVGAALAGWMVLLGARTFLRQEDWHDPRTFIERTIADGGGSPRMHMNLGNVEFAEGRQDRALAHYREALRRAPDQPMIWLSYTSVLLRSRDFAAARDALAHAEKSPMLTAECYRTRAALENLETGRDTGNLLRDALDAAPRNWSIRKQYVEYLIQRDENEEAMREMRDVIQFHGFRNETWKLMGQILESINRPDLALGAYEQAAKRDVHDEAVRTHIRELAAKK